MLDKLFRLDASKCNKGDRSWELEIPQHGSYSIPDFPIAMRDIAVLAEAVRLWIAEQDWKFWHEPLHQEHIIVIQSNNGSTYSAMASVYVEALLSAYIKVLEQKEPSLPVQGSLLR